MPLVYLCYASWFAVDEAVRLREARSSAATAANNLSASNQMLEKSLNRLASGSKIVSPSDDAGGLAVSMQLAAAAKRQGAVNNNIGNAISFL